MGPVKKPRANDPCKPSTRKARDRRADNSPSRRRQPRLRCPFHAKDPDKFRGYNSSCQGTGFETNARVVEHLKRTHGPIELSNGIADAKADVLQSPPQTPADYEIERVTQEQLILIAKLPRKSNIEEKWDMIYKVIFPGEEAIKPAYMPSLEQLRDHARNPPEWLITNLIAGGIGESRQEILSMMQNFLVFFDIIGGGSSSLPASTHQPPPDGVPEILVQRSSMNDMHGRGNKSEARSRDSHEDDAFGYNDRETSSHVHGSPSGKIITCSFE